VPTSSSHATPQRLALVCQVLAARHRVAHPDTVALLALRRRHPPAWTGLRKPWTPPSLHSPTPNTRVSVPAKAPLPRVPLAGCGSPSPPHATTTSCLAAPTVASQGSISAGRHVMSKLTHHARQLLPTPPRGRPAYLPTGRGPSTVVPL
jgi:hypothetical protein